MVNPATNPNGYACTVCTRHCQTGAIKRTYIIFANMQRQFKWTLCLYTIHMRVTISGWRPSSYEDGRRHLRVTLQMHSPNCRSVSNRRMYRSIPISTARFVILGQLSVTARSHRYDTDRTGAYRICIPARSGWVCFFPSTISHDHRDLLKLSRLSKPFSMSIAFS